MTGPRQWSIRLVYLDLPLSLNDRRHRMVIWREQRNLRDRVRWETRRQSIPRLERVHVGMEWIPATKRRRDQDNAVATLKSAIDGLRDYQPTKRNPAGWVGIVPDDTPEHVTWSPPIILPPDPAVTERLVLTITDLTNEKGTTQ